jgi:hypothetical protein
MEIKLSGRNAVAIAGIVVLEAIVACVAIDKAEKATKKAHEKSFEAAVYKFSDYVKGIRIKDLEKENAKLKSERKK